MVHPDKSMLLGYTRRQSLGEAESYIRQHIELCEECALLCHEYEQVSAGLQDTLEYWKRTSVYSPLVERVLEKIENPDAVQLAHRKRQVDRQRQNATSSTKRQSLNWTRLLSTGVVILLIITVFTSFMLHESLFQPNNNKQANPGSTKVPSPLRTASPTPTLTPQVTGTAEVTGGTIATPVAQSMTLNICKVSAYSFTLCGSHLQPGDVVEVTVNIRGKGALPQHVVMVSKDGRLTVMWYVNICSINRVNVHVHSRKTSLDTSQVLSVPVRNCSISMDQ